MKKLSIILLSSLFLLLTNCKDDEECTDIELAFTSLEAAYGCTNTPFQMNIDLEEDFTIISTQETFDTLITGSCTPEIDFDTYDLIIGKKALGNGVASISYEMIQDCEDESIALTVTVVTDDTEIAPNITYHVLVNKLEFDETVNVEVTVN